MEARGLIMRVIFAISGFIMCAIGFDYKSALSDPEWETVINDGGLHVGSSRVKRFVELNDSSPNLPYQPCLLPDGKTGHCRHLHHCIQEEFRTDFIRFMDYLCIIKRTFPSDLELKKKWFEVIPGNLRESSVVCTLHFKPEDYRTEARKRSVGACCPDEELPGGDGSVAGDLPATAPLEEANVALRVARAENRGCGLSTRATSKLIGARPADPREWPWMAFITPEGFVQYCGGALITDRHVLTAAHCTRRWKAEELFVRLGEYDFKRTNDSRSYNFKVVEKRQHDLFDFSNYLNDIAILKMDRAAVFNTYVWPLCLPPIGMDLVNESAVIIGWGTLSFGGPQSSVLMEVSVPVWDLGQCFDALAENVFETNLCAGAYEGGRDACQGDSGGPLMYQMPSGRWTIIGIVSWGVRCGEPNHPGLYTRVDKYLPWIIENARF